MPHEANPAKTSDSQHQGSLVNDCLLNLGCTSADRALGSCHVDQAVAAGYAEALDYLYGRINYEKIGNTPYNAGHYRLDRMRQLLELLGNPHLRYPIVHVAGTKGKGTTATVLAHCLRACGYRTGLYTSPHLQRLEERIRVQGESCTSWELVELTAAVRSAAEQLDRAGGGKATFFELTTAMGLLHFARIAADAVVLEVGLGGRLDSTNVCQPVISVITSISLDHQAQLGDTIEAIAREKAGIIKPQTPVVCTARGAAAQTVILQVAEEQRADVRLIERDFSVNWRPLLEPPPTVVANINTPRAEVAYQPNYPYRECSSDPQEETRSDVARTGSPHNADGTLWMTRLLGRHQADNIAAVLATLDILRQQQWVLPIGNIQSAIAHSHPPARLEIIGRQPLAIIDSAHNPASIHAGLNALSEHFPECRPTTIFAASRDKDWLAMLSELLARSGRLVLTAYQENPRALPLDRLFTAAEHLQASMQSTGGKHTLLQTAETPAEAWKLAHAITGASGLIYATGSFFLAAELLDFLSDKA